MSQLEGFSSSENGHMVCRLKKSIYGLKQASHQWYFKFHGVISSFGFMENVINQCIHLKVSGSKFIFLVLYVDDILLASSYLGLLQKVKQFLAPNFDMKDVGKTSYAIDIETLRDKSLRILGLSQRAYINKVLERFRMKDCSPGVAPIVKVDKFFQDQCPRNDLDLEQMKNIPQTSMVESLIYAQVCTRLDIGFTLGMSGKYQSNPSMDHWRVAKKVKHYL